MIDRRELLAIAGSLGILPNVVEKDYVLSWVLAGISAHQALGPAWIFKGGTCLKKCYFETYRFSEDLDFTVTEAQHFDGEFLRSCFEEISAWVYEQTGIELPTDRLRFDVFENPRGKPAAQGRISYRGPIAPSGGDLPRIKLDLTFDEVVVLEPVERRVAHPYSDDPDAGLAARCYAYEEAFAEKIRALAERARPRDLYDVVNLYRNIENRPNPRAIRDVLEQKCAFKGIPLPSLAALDSARDELEGDWAAMLGQQLPALPPVAVFWNELPAVFAWIDGAQQPAPPEPMPMAAGDVVVRAPLGGIAIPGGASSAPLETIRFAAFNRLCVELDYTGEQGRRSTRTIEPYSLRRSQAGDLLLHAVRADDGGSRTYRVDRINRAQLTDRIFIPRYVIELTPMGPISAPMTARGPTIAALRPTASARRRSAHRTGPVYVYQCSYCGRRFEHRTRNASLRKHNGEGGWPCTGRRGMLVDTRW